jgi:hypothetical protein
VTESIHDAAPRPESMRPSADSERPPVGTSAMDRRCAAFAATSARANRLARAAGKAGIGMRLY